jgi:hypothetical protein
MIVSLATWMKKVNDKFIDELREDESIFEDGSGR